MPETPVACINTIVNTAENQSLFTQISVGRDNKVGWKKEGGEGRLRRCILPCGQKSCYVPSWIGRGMRRVIASRVLQPIIKQPLPHRTGTADLETVRRRWYQRCRPTDAFKGTNDASMWSVGRISLTEYEGSLPFDTTLPLTRLKCRLWTKLGISQTGKMLKSKIYLRKHV